MIRKRPICALPWLHHAAGKVQGALRSTRRRCAALVLAAACVLPAGAASTIDLAGVQIPHYLQTPYGLLEVASCGVRDTLWFEHYVAALYVPRGTSTQAVADRASPKAVVMEIVDERFLPDRIPAKWRKPLSASLDPATFSRVQRAFGGLGSGDRVTLVYLPRDGLTMRVNGRLVAQGEGHRVIDAILHAWRENDTIDQRLARLPANHPCR